MRKPDEHPLQELPVAHLSVNMCLCANSCHRSASALWGAPNPTSSHPCFGKSPTGFVCALTRGGCVLPAPGTVQLTEDLFNFPYNNFPLQPWLLAATQP